MTTVGKIEALVEKEKQLFDSKIGWIRFEARILKIQEELFGNYFVW